MSANPPAPDPGGEREIDLRRWLDALLSRWWIAVLGLVIGVAIGAVYSLSGGSSWVATALIARGQAFTPSGNGTVLSYLSSPAAVEQYATSPQAIAYAAAKAGLTPGELEGHISTSTIGRNGLAQADTNSILVQISVQLKKAKKAELAANALARLIRRQTTTPYVLQSISIFHTRLANYRARLKTLQTRITSLNRTLTDSTGISALDQLVIATQLDAAEAAYGSTLDTQLTTQQELTLAQTVERTQIVQSAVATKTLARSRRNSVVFGGLIGLIIGTVVALVLGLRATPKQATA
jgi:hypothetical protein